MALNPLPTYHSVTRISPHQINLRQLFSVKHILASRGYKIKKEGDLTDLLIHPLKHGPEYELLVQTFNDKKSRVEILNFINDRGNPTRPDVIKLTTSPHFVKDSNAFTKTFEWYIGEAMVRFFEGFSFAYGIDVLNVRVDETNSGDFDTLVVMRNLRLMYFECKTGGFESSKISKAVQRAISLNCESAIIVAFKLDEKKLVDTISNTNHPIYGQGVKIGLTKIQIISSPKSSVYEWHNCYFISASEDFVEQMKTVIRILEAKRNYYNYRYRPTSADKRLFSRLGFVIQGLIPSLAFIFTHFNSLFYLN